MEINVHVGRMLPSIYEKISVWSAHTCRHIFVKGNKRAGENGAPGMSSGSADALLLTHLRHMAAISLLLLPRYT